jgi:hypothetical protein
MLITVVVAVAVAIVVAASLLLLLSIYSNNYNLQIVAPHSFSSTKDDFDLTLLLSSMKKFDLYNHCYPKH